MRIGIDAGGTFTDFIVARDDGSLETFKLRSNPRNPAAVILEGLNRAAGSRKRGIEVVHGSTVATIALRPSTRELATLKARLKRAGVESVAICFLHAYSTPGNEQAVAAALAGVGYLCCSHDVCPEFREYERTSTTVINAYVGPLMDRYLARLE